MFVEIKGMTSLASRWLTGKTNPSTTRSYCGKFATGSRGGVGMCHPPQVALRTCPATAQVAEQWSSSLSLHASVGAEARHQYSPPRNKTWTDIFVWTEPPGDSGADGAQQLLPITANYIPSCWWVGELDEKEEVEGRKHAEERADKTGQGVPVTPLCHHLPPSKQSNSISTSRGSEKVFPEIVEAFVKATIFSALTSPQCTGGQPQAWST